MILTARQRVDMVLVELVKVVVVVVEVTLGVEGGGGWWRCVVFSIYSNLHVTQGVVDVTMGYF